MRYQRTTTKLLPLRCELTFGSPFLARTRNASANGCVDTYWPGFVLNVLDDRRRRLSRRIRRCQRRVQAMTISDLNTFAFCDSTIYVNRDVIYVGK